MKRVVTKEVCAYCVGILYDDSTQLISLDIKYKNEHTIVSRWQPYDIVEMILNDAIVISRGTLMSFNLAVTTINGTALCGWHASEQLKGRL